MTQQYKNNFSYDTNYTDGTCILDFFKPLQKSHNFVHFKMKLSCNTLFNKILFSHPLGC